MKTGSILPSITAQTALITVVGAHLKMASVWSSEQLDVVAMLSTTKKLIADDLRILSVCHGLSMRG